LINPLRILGTAVDWISGSNLLEQKFIFQVSSHLCT